VAARDVRRYAAIVTYLALAVTAFGIVLLWINVKAGLPWFWIAGEGPFTIAMGLAVLVLQRRIDAVHPK
jgi:hypothetical protein